MDRPEISKDVLSDRREQLRYWPYTTHQIDETLDIGLIEGKAKQILFQALNARRLCAFAGSGLSASYGRLTWGDWKEEQISVVRRNADAFLELAGAAKDWINDLLKCLAEDEESNLPWIKNLRQSIATELHETQQYRRNLIGWLKVRRGMVDQARQEITQLNQTFKLATGKTGNFPGGEALPIEFEIAQQLHAQLRRHVLMFALRDRNDQTNDKTFYTHFWAGSQDSMQSAAPQEALEWFRRLLVTEFSGKHYFLKTGLNEPSSGTTYKDKWDSFQKIDQMGASRISFEQLAKFLLVDECGHASVLLRKGLERGDVNGNGGKNQKNEDEWAKLEKYFNLFDEKKLKRAVDGIRNDPARYRVLSLFTFEALKRIQTKSESDTAARGWKTLQIKVGERLDAYVKQAADGHDTRRFLTPTSRFLTSCYLRLLADPYESLNLSSNNSRSLVSEPNRSDFTSRRSIIADRFDPLATTIRKLGIKNYITTNYDFEIERFFVDGGYRRFGPSTLNTADNPLEPKEDEFRRDHLGGTLRDRTFKREEAAQLVSFAVGHEPAAASIYHLHGRSTLDDPLVISERDYLDLYLSEDDQRETVDEAIALAFSASPTLFLGLGMTETDMLRPLRQFISNRDRAMGYNAIALLPAEKGYEERVKTVSALYLRYGVHTIFYGGGTVETKNIDGTIEEVGIDWLYRILALTGAVTKCVDDWLEKLEPDPSSVNAPVLPTIDNKVHAKNLLKAIDKAVGSLGADLAHVDGPDEKERALNLLCGLRSTELQSTDILRHFQSRTAPDDTEYLFKSPEFTPVRRPATNETHRHSSGKVTTPGDVYVGFYLRMLEDMVRMCLNTKVSDWGSARTNEKARIEVAKRDLHARKILLDGIWSAFIGTSMNAALEGLSREWRAWWKDWQDPPAEREARFERFPYVKDATSNDPGAAQNLRFLAPVRYIRHRVDSVITDMTRTEATTGPPVLEIGPTPDDPRSEGKLVREIRTNIRSFDTFIAAVEKQQRGNTNGHDKRRIYTVAALRGQGKGTFMSAMSSRLGLSLYSRAAWPEPVTLNPLPFEYKPVRTAFAGAVFINYSFSSEIASTYDMLIEAVHHSAARIGAMADVLGQISAPYSGISGPLESLELAVFSRGELTNPNDVSPTWWPKWRRAYQDRIDKTNADADQTSRMGRLKGALEHFAKVSGDYASNTAKVFDHSRDSRLFVCLNAADLLFWADGRPKNREIAEFLEILAGSDTDKLPIDLVVIGSETGLGFPWRLPKNMLEDGVTTQNESGGSQTQCIAHPLRLLQIDREAMPQPAHEHIERRRRIGNLHVVTEDKHKPEKPVDGFIHYARPVSPTEMMISNFPVLARSLFLLDYADRLVEGTGHREHEVIFRGLSDMAIMARRDVDKALKNRWADSDIPTPEELSEISDDKAGKFITALDERVREYSKKPGRPVDRILRARYRNAESPAKVEWNKVRRHLSGNRFCLTILLAAADHMVRHSRDLEQGTRDAEKYIWSTVDQVRNVGTHRKEDMVLEATLEVYRRYQVINDAHADIDLHMLLIRHLASIGTPISAAVLVRLPEFRDYFAGLREETSISRRRTVAAALSILCQRGLVFRLSPNPSLLRMRADGKPLKRDWPLNLEFRYGVHRVVQRHATSLLGQGRVDPVRNNSFSPTLYASMTSSGPRLSREAYVFLRRQMVALSQYPDIPASQDEQGPRPFAMCEGEIKVQALRAALSLARATFSVASISRFADYGRLMPQSFGRGYLETYKIRLRWIIRRAWELRDRGEAEKKQGFDALYQDEVVWLYNELGVTSLAQGNLSDALAQLRQAAEFCAQIEGSPRLGPQNNLIGLNHAVVQLERGRLTSARDRLDRIKRDSSTQPGTVHYMTRGYLCVLDNLMGRTEGLASRFQEVTHYFQDRGDNRAAAIFLNHRARFLRGLNPDKAKSLLRTAHQLAETGGHEDIRHHVQLADLVVEHLEELQGKPSRQDKYRKLRQIETFGRNMGIWSLQSDALQLHARILIEQGETSNAGKLLGRALAIANRCSMTLRSNGGLTLYADLLRRRGDLDGGETIAIASLQLAKSCGYSVEAVRAQAVMALIREI